MEKVSTAEWTRQLFGNLSDISYAVTTGLDGAISMSGSTGLVQNDGTLGTHM